MRSARPVLGGAARDETLRLAHEQHRTTACCGNSSITAGSDPRRGVSRIKPRSCSAGSGPRPLFHCVSARALQICRREECLAPRVSDGPRSARETAPRCPRERWVLETLWCRSRRSRLILGAAERLAIGPTPRRPLNDTVAEEHTSRTTTPLPAGVPPGSLGECRVSGCDDLE